MVSCNEVSQSLLVQSSYGLAEVSESLSVVEVEDFGVVILDDPREDRVLCQVQC